MNKKVIILGISGTSKDIIDTIIDLNTSSKDQNIKILGFLDDNLDNKGKKINGVKVIGSLKDAKKYRGSYFINGIGSPNSFYKRPEIIKLIGIKKDRFITLIHPTTYISPTAKIGYGSIILQNVTVNSNAVIGDQVTILPNSVISHNCVIGSYSCLASGVLLAGEVIIGKASYLGMGCSILGNLKIGKFCLIGMGAVVLKDIPDQSVYAGNPAKFLHKLMLDN